MIFRIFAIFFKIISRKISIFCAINSLNYLIQFYEHVNNKNNNVYNKKSKKFVWKKKRQKIEKVRIIKQRAKIFACKRCLIKFSNNTKFHQHIQNYYQKKFTKFANKFAIYTFIFIAFFKFFLNEFAIFILNSKFTSKIMYYKFWTKSHESWE